MPPKKRPAKKRGAPSTQSTAKVARPKSKAKAKAKGKGRRGRRVPSPEESSVEEEAGVETHGPVHEPAMPEDAHPINVENLLGNLPPGDRWWEQPWFFYDRVDPAPYFRHVSQSDIPEEPYVPEAKDADMSEFPDADMKALWVAGYK